MNIRNQMGLISSQSLFVKATVLLLLFSSWTAQLNAQEYYFFKQGNYWIEKYSPKHKIKASEVILVFDTAQSPEEKKFNEKFAEELIKSLSKKKIKASYLLEGQKNRESDNLKTLQIKFDNLGRGRVKLSLFNLHLSVCWKYEIRQMNLIHEKQKRPLASWIALSTESEETAIQKGSKALAKFIKRCLKN